MVFELAQIFSEPLTTTVFLYASATMLTAYAAAALWIRSPYGLLRQRHSPAKLRA